MPKEEVPTLSRQKYVDGQIMFILKMLKNLDKRVKTLTRIVDKEK